MKKSGMILAMCLAASLTGWSEQVPPVAKTGGESIISINVQDADMVSVLKLLAAQADCSVVVGPDVAATKLNIDLRNVPLDNALDAILKPHGYGYRQLGNTIVVDKLQNLQAVTLVEPLVSKVFQLKFIDASDATNVVAGLLSERGKCKVLHVSQTLGWEFTGASSDTAARKAARITASKNKAPSASKTLIVQDVPSSISQIETILNQVDVKSRQVEIRAYFVEMSGDALKDIGMNWNLDIKGGEYSTADLIDPAVSTIANGVDPKLGGTDFNNLPSSGRANDYNGGLDFGIARTGSQWDMDIWLRALEQNGDANVLSAPRITTQDNQEAAIVVGTRLPIISTTKEVKDSGLVTYTTELDYYEQVGIQLNVSPKICDDGMINLILHPSVAEKVDEVTGGDEEQLNAYPVIDSREAETRLTVKDGQPVAIGGLISDRREKNVQKVPLLGDIPLLGRLFRRDVDSSKKVELMILLSASVIDDFEDASATFDQRVETSKKAMTSKWETINQGEVVEADVSTEAVPAEDEVAPVEAAPVEVAPVVAPVAVVPAETVSGTVAAPASSQLPSEDSLFGNRTETTEEIYNRLSK
jgi:type IV pilus assembly protein PilQ